MSEEGKSPFDPRLDVLEACAVLHLHVRYVIKPDDPKNASQASHVESLQAICISLKVSAQYKSAERTHVS